MRLNAPELTKTSGGAHCSACFMWEKQEEKTGKQEIKSKRKTFCVQFSVQNEILITIFLCLVLVLDY